MREASTAHPGNWRLLEAASLLLAGWLFPEFRDAGQWVQAGRDRLETEVEAFEPSPNLATRLGIW